MNHDVMDSIDPVYNEIIVEHVGANMGIQIPLLGIGWRVVSIMSTWFPNP